MSESEKRMLGAEELLNAAGGGAGQESRPDYGEDGGEVVFDPSFSGEAVCCVNTSCANYYQEVKNSKTCPLCGGKLYPMIDYVRR